MSIRSVFVTDESRPGATTGRVLMVDDRIIIDDYIPSQPNALWYCDNCEDGYPVTAQFAHGDGHITLCATCLQYALNGIAVSLSKPIASEDI